MAPSSQYLIIILLSFHRKCFIRLKMRLNKGLVKVVDQVALSIYSLLFFVV